jgi:hypothetical protein
LGQPFSLADSVRTGSRVVHRCRFNFLREAQIWYDRDSFQDSGEEHFENVIVLSDEFYNEILAHPIPTDVDAVKALVSAPAVLDLFMWLVYRCFVAKREERIPLFGEFGLTAQLGSVEYTRPHREEVDRYQTLDVILQEGPPRLRWRLAAAHHVFANAGFADVDTEFEVFAVDARRSP